MKIGLEREKLNNKLRTKNLNRTEMKVKVLLLAITCSLGAFGAYAQKGVDNGTQYGSGEDSVRCIENISLFIPYAKAKNYKDAYEFWKIVYEECPASTKDVYLYGVRIVDWEIQNEKDPAKKEALIDKLMEVYDKRVKYFGDDKRYGKDWILARKAQDYIRLKGENADPNLIYSWLQVALDEYKENTDPLAVSLYMYASLQKLLKDPNFKEQYIQDYLRSSAIYEAQLKAAQAANNEKEINQVTTLKGVLDNAFAQSGAADCETLQNMYGPKVAENKDDLKFLKETIALLRRVRCQEIEAYFMASEAVHKVEPTVESAIGCAKQALKKKEYDQAINYFEEAIKLETDEAAKSDYYYTIALLLFDQKNYAKSRQYALKAIEANPKSGAPYMLIGNMYAATASGIYPNDPVLAKTVYYAVVDKFEKAKQVDPSIAEEANKLIATYRQYFPSKEDIFMHPDLENGKTITIGGWIGETTRVR